MICDAQPGDAAALAALWNPWITQTAITFHPTARSEAELAQMITARQQAGQGFWLARDAAGEVQGFASYGPFRHGPGYARSMEHSIILRRGLQGRGLGRALMLHLEDHARKAGVHLMVGAVTGENAAGRAFHTAMGYQAHGPLPGAGYKFGRHIDLWFYSKQL